jgi:hypothetical protein
MSFIYTPTAAALTTLTLPNDGDPRTAASVNGPLEALANGLIALGSAGTLRHQIFQVGSPVPGATQTWVVPPGCTLILVRMFGGGGGGGGGANNPGSTARASGGGGGGGAIEHWTAVAVTPGETITIALSPGGAGGVAGSMGGFGGATQIKRGLTVIANVFGGSGGHPGNNTGGVDANYAWGIGGCPSDMLLNEIPDDPANFPYTSSTWLHFVNTIGPQCGMHGLTGNHPWNPYRVAGGSSRVALGGKTGAGSTATSGVYRGGGGGGGGGGGMGGVGGDGGAGSPTPAATTASNGSPGVAAPASSGAGGGGGGGAAGSTSGGVVGGAGGAGGSGQAEFIYVQSS